MIKHMRTFGNVFLLIKLHLPGEKRPLAASMTTLFFSFFKKICISSSNAHKHKVPLYLSPSCRCRSPELPRPERRTSVKNTQIKHQSRRAMETPRSQYLHPGHAAHVASGTLHETFDSFKFKPLFGKSTVTAGQTHVLHLKKKKKKIKLKSATK